VAILFDGVDLQVHAAFGVLPNVLPTAGQWVSIGADVESVNTKSNGRSDPWSGFTTGGATIVLDNTSRAYDALYTAGPYFGLIRTDTWIKIQAVGSGFDEIIFLGLAEDWVPTYSGVGAATVVVQCKDQIARIAQAEVDMTAIAGKTLQTLAVAIFAMAQVDGARIHNYVPTAQYYCRSMIAPESGSLIEILKACETVEQGRLFTISPTDGYGAIGLLTSTEVLIGAGWSIGTIDIGDGSSMPVPEDPFNWSSGAQDIRTSIVCGAYRASTPSPVVIRREESIDAPWGHVEDAQSIATWQSQQWGSPRPRYEQIAINLRTNHNAGVNPYITLVGLSSRLTHRVRVVKQPLGGAVINITGMVEQVEHEITPVSWMMTLTLSPTLDVGGTQTYGRLDSWPLDSTTLKLSP
jgi:hypothetical protein